MLDSTETQVYSIRMPKEARRSLQMAAAGTNYKQGEVIDILVSKFFSDAIKAAWEFNIDRYDHEANWRVRQALLEYYSKGDIGKSVYQDIMKRIAKDYPEKE